MWATRPGNKGNRLPSLLSPLSSKADANRGNLLVVHSSNGPSSTMMVDRRGRRGNQALAPSPEWAGAHKFFRYFCFQKSFCPSLSFQPRLHVLTKPLLPQFSFAISFVSVSYLYAHIPSPYPISYLPMMQNPTSDTYVFLFSLHDVFYLHLPPYTRYTFLPSIIVPNRPPPYISHNPIIS